MNTILKRFSLTGPLAFLLAACWPVIALAEPIQPAGLDYAGISALKQLDPNLTGSGIKYAVICRSINYLDDKPQNDFLPNIEHRCFSKKQLNFYNQPDPPAGISPHSTAICSILLGDDPNAFNPQLGRFRYRAVTPKAQADVYEFRHFLTNNVFSASDPKADIITASIGSQFEDWWTRGIESIAEQYGTIIVAGIGNGTDVYDPILYPAGSANVIGVGVVDCVSSEDTATALSNFALPYPQHSSYGPAHDRRTKPDIVAPGNLLAAQANDTNRYEPTGSWSSFSTPIVAGTIGLLMQKAKQAPSLAEAVSGNTGNCLIKAIIINSARKLPFWHKGKLTKHDDHLVPLDYLQGAGLPNAPGAYKHLTAGENKPGDAAQINKHYNPTYPFEPIPQNNSNLRLELWAIDSAEPANSYLLDYSDSSVDNVEHIYTPADPNYNSYEIVVSFSDADTAEKTERYALAWNISPKKSADDILLYDLNADGTVGNADSIILITNWLKSSLSDNEYLLGDINDDALIDANDLKILINHIGQSATWKNI
ncbi:MAG: S8 family serine peptidase [Planctomycetota bacterium]|jgi:hypothetical protein